MSMRQVARAGLSVGVALALMVPVAAQKNKATSRPATVEFRCDIGQASPCPAASTGGDGVLGDVSSDYTGTGTPEGGQGAHLRSQGEIWIGLRNGVSAGLDLSKLAAAGGCEQPPGNCRFAAAGLSNGLFAIPIGGNGPAGVYAEIQGDVVSKANASDTTPTMLSIPVNDLGWKLRMFVGFADDVMNLTWAFNFAQNRYPGATDANVMRTTACTWVIWADGSARAGLSAYGSDYGRGKSYRTEEGLYSAPFLFTFQVPSLCPA